MNGFMEKLKDIYADGGDWEDFEPVFKRAEELLHRASLDTENYGLYEELVHFLKTGDTDGIGT